MASFCSEHSHRPAMHARVCTNAVLETQAVVIHYAKSGSEHLWHEQRKGNLGWWLICKAKFGALS